MSFWVYENWTHKKAIVHKSDCSYCNGGRGVHSERSDKNGKWHGPFPDREAAFKYARTTNREDIRACNVCGA
ncbi:MAG: hypothetical protein PHD48_11885 [Alphaproteobacteria bacterium]|nr:hypothetical protein [Alphaproteobacteria bacterium]